MSEKPPQLFHFRLRTLIFVVAVSAIFAACVAYATRENPPLSLIVPVGFRGTITVIRDSVAGQALSSDRGVYVFKIPASGTLRVKDSWPFHRWHKEECRDVDGRLREIQDSSVTLEGDVRSTDDDGVVYTWEVL